MDLNNTWDDEDQLDEEDTFEDEELEDLNDEDGDCGDDDEDDLDDSTEPVPSTSYSVYRRKYLLLLERCRAIQQDNELLVSRVAEVRRLWKRGLRERRLIINRLDTYGDNFRNVPLVIPAEEESSKKMKDKRLKKAGNGGNDDVGGSSRGRKHKGDKDKPPRDPNLPKRPQNPFFQFCKEKRDEVAQEVLHAEGVNLSKKELTKLLANRWNTLDSNDKMIYNERFEEEKAGYNIKMEIYRKKREESANQNQNLNMNLLTSSPTHNLHTPLSSTFDYEDSFDC